MIIHPDEAELDALLDGDLASEEAESIRNHLDRCAECDAKRTALVTLRGALNQVSRPQPPANMASGIWAALDGTAIAPKRSTTAPKRTSFARKRAVWLSAGAVVACAAGAALLLRKGESHHQQATQEHAISAASGQRSLPESASAPTGDLEDPSAEVIATEARYEEAISKLRSAVLRKQTNDPDPKMQAIFVSTLAEIDSAIFRARAQARRLPQDSAVHDAMAAAYRRKVDFLENALFFESGSASSSSSFGSVQAIPTVWEVAP